jgi:hypothetical protein
LGIGAHEILVVFVYDGILSLRGKQQTEDAASESEDAKPADSSALMQHFIHIDEKFRFVRSANQPEIDNEDFSKVL